MKASELIQRLQEAIVLYGDIEARFIGTLSESEEDDSVPIAGLSIYLNEGGRPEYVLVCDDLTLDAFTGLAEVENQ